MAAQACAFTRIAAAGIIIVLSAELYHAMIWFNYKNGTHWLMVEEPLLQSRAEHFAGIMFFAMMWQA